MDLPAQIAALPADTMTALARLVLGDETAEVGGWQCQPLIGGIGVATAGIVRVEGTARVAGAEVPWSLVLKVIQLDLGDEARSILEQQA